MLRITYITDGTGEDDGLVLCNTTRSMTELNVKLNHKRLNDVALLWDAAAAVARDFGNQRNTLSLTVRRGVDFAAVAFADELDAFLFALDQPGQFPTTGTLKLELHGGGGTNATRWLLNCAIEGLSLADWLGIAPSFDYTFNGGLITAAAPAFPITAP